MIDNVVDTWLIGAFAVLICISGYAKRDTIDPGTAVFISMLWPIALGLWLWSTFWRWVRA